MCMREYKKKMKTYKDMQIIKASETLRSFRELTVAQIR